MDAGRRTPPSVSAWHRGKPGSGGPARPGLGAPRPPRPCPPPRAAPPQRRRSVSGPGASGARPPPAPASPPEASAAPSILGNSLISLGSGGGIPLLIWRFRPRLRESGGRARGARTRSPGCRQDARAPARPPPCRESARLRRRAGGRHRDRGEHPGGSSPAGGGIAGRTPPPPARPTRLPPVPAEGPRAGSSAAADAEEFPGRWQRAPGGGCLLPEKGISGTPQLCRESLAPPAPAESGGALPAAPDRGRPRRSAPPARDGERGTAKTGALGTARP